MENVVNSVLDTYRFTSVLEPTDEQLSLLMQEVSADVKKRYDISQAKFWSELQQMYNEKILCNLI